MVAALWGTFLISLMIVSVDKFFELTLQEKKAMHHLMQTRKAAQTITAAMRYWLATKRFEEHRQHVECLNESHSHRSTNVF